MFRGNVAWCLCIARRDSTLHGRLRRRAARASSELSPLPFCWTFRREGRRCGTARRKGLLSATTFPSIGLKAFDLTTLRRAKKPRLGRRRIAAIGGVGHAKISASGFSRSRTLRRARNRCGPADREAAAGAGRDPGVALLMAFRDHRLWLGHGPRWPIRRGAISDRIVLHQFPETSRTFPRRVDDRVRRPQRHVHRRSRRDFVAHRGRDQFRRADEPALSRPRQPHAD